MERGTHNFGIEMYYEYIANQNNIALYLVWLQQ